MGWFSALCDDDYEFLGVPDPALVSSFEHCRDIVLEAERQGFDNILLPSGYDLGIDGTVFAGGIAPLTERIKVLLAVRTGELVVAQLARQLASLDRMLDGRLAVNLISSDLPGERLDSEARYRRTLETALALRTLLSGTDLDQHGDYLDVTLAPPRVALGARCPAFYFGGLSEPAKQVAAKVADVYLMWPDRMGAVASLVAEMRERAAAEGRSLRVGYRVHVIVRPSEDEAREAARRLLSRLDAADGASTRARSLDARSTGTARQGELRQSSDDEGYVEDNLWTGIGRARSGCGAAIVGDPEQVLGKLASYRSAGIDAFILSGYPHIDECERFGRLVLPRIDHAPLGHFS